jgi:hypothetical protein
MARPLRAHVSAIVENAKTPLTDADQLIASFRVRAYSEARRRQRQAETPESASHWGQVASLISGRTGDRRDDEGSSRRETDVNGAALKRGSDHRAVARFFEIDQLAELERVLAVRPQCFRLQYFGAGDDNGPSVLTETEIQATDASGAIRAAVAAGWPPRAVGLRVLDLDGREIFERLKADLR